MEALRESVGTTLPNLSTEEVDSVLEKLLSDGVEGPEDLKYVEAGDLTMLRPIQARKLLQHWKGAKGNFHTLLLHHNLHHWFFFQYRYCQSTLSYFYLTAIEYIFYTVIEFNFVLL